ncbi:DUF927 domain-containing protein [Anaerobaca lacustris]|uniref:DUF927 domain-containing protein n=1 Tax=Anaerobaca lacustris TaxID=3044600 RepID=A0AAW6TZ04_9BACT|nr:DUF927 domain-containing protein [Sedimentisphaerales bacterium M17dextr]
MKEREITQVYDYSDESGELLFQVVRYAPKGFRQRRPDDKGGWIWNLNNTRRVLYRLPELLKATMQDWVFVVEGEKDCDHLCGEGFDATCSPMGAAKWRKEYNEFFKGRLVAIIPDNDLAGRKHAQQVAESLSSVAGEVRIVELPDLQTGGDVSDWLDNGGTKEQLLNLVDQSYAYQPSLKNAIECRDHPYLETENGLVWLKPTRDGETSVQLTNFTARIVGDCAHDDGVERTALFELDARLEGCSQCFAVSAPEFTAMTWPAKHLGARAIIFPGTTKREHARAAIQLLSKDITRQIKYAHTGWREVGGQWVYLHAGGALGASGPVRNVVTELSDTLCHYCLPDPPEGELLRNAIWASLRILDLVPDTVGWPLLCLPWCAVLGVGTFTCHLVGDTGTGKSQLAALIQQHFGPEIEATRLPGSWASTANALQGLAFVAKDALLTIDDFAPGGTQRDVQQLHRKAGDIIRSQANRSGRLRMRADTTLRPSKPPRGLILSTGEDTPRGQSIQARMVVVELGRNELEWSKLSACQRDGAAGLYAQVTSGFVCWLAAQYEEKKSGVRDELIALREEASKGMLHRRTPTSTAELAIAAKCFLRFAELSGAISHEEHLVHWQRCWAALMHIAASQTAHQTAANPVVRYLELLGSALACGTAHVAGPDGQEPANPKAWGWREKGIHSSLERMWQPQGDRIGWVDRESLYLDPDASYKVAQSMTGNGEGLVISARTLRKRLHEQRLLMVEGKRETLTVRRILEGAQRNVLYLLAESIRGYVPAEPDIPDNSDNGLGSYSSDDCSTSGDLSGFTHDATASLPARDRPEPF